MAKPEIEVEWIKCKGDVWCSLESLDLSTVTEDSEGVYVIWHGGQTPRWVRVGQGNFKERFSAHRNDPKITKYNKDGTLYVTWAKLPKSDRDGVEYYLFQRTRPLVGTVSKAREITVNLP